MPSQVEHRPPQRPGEPPVRVEWSSRRRARASAFLRHGVVVVQLPADLTGVVAEHTIGDLVGRVTRRHLAERRGGDAWLSDRARTVGDHWLDGIRADSVTWSNRMSRRWASATPANGSIRISTAAATFPGRVLDHLLVHELAHLVVPDHSRAFHDLVARYPHRDFAIGFLAGIAHAQAIGPGDAPPKVGETGADQSSEAPPLG